MDSGKGKQGPPSRKVKQISCCGVLGVGIEKKSASMYLVFQFVPGALFIADFCTSKSCTHAHLCIYITSIYSFDEILRNMSCIIYELLQRVCMPFWPQIKLFLVRPSQRQAFHEARTVKETTKKEEPTEPTTEDAKQEDSTKPKGLSGDIFGGGGALAGGWRKRMEERELKQRQEELSVDNVSAFPSLKDAMSA